ncbi:hypothetical protein [Nonomuraea rubra]|uniref:Uncharacterized protein n=1 Tax=Nonomuraea rubra TaxID=46180 RepID=A0A7X0P6L8_9ACTN|nr:hypothetical protein [Nonomuraea rubra]MBB6556242.1 hypothetical protein [Nonomuraea rubra]
MTHMDDLSSPNDREPGEPEEPEQAPPLDLDALEKLLDLAAGPDALPAWGQMVYIQVPDLIAELRAARQRIAEWEALEKREEWAVTGGPNFPAEPSGPPISPDKGVIAYVNRHAAAQLWRRMLSVHAWEPVDSEAPF